MEKMKRVKIADISQPENSRVVYKPADLAELMESIKRDGLLQPIGVRDIGKGKYECVWGNRRLMAALKLGWVDIPVHVVELETDTDRDILGLIENFKRVNTSVAEDGRMFQSLIDRGLNKNEIAARLSIPVERVELALDVFTHVPKELKKLVKYVPTGKNRQDGTISAQAAQSILSMRRQHGLSKSQTSELLKYASTKDANLTKIQHIAPLVAQGVKPAKAISMVASMSRIVMYVFMDRRDITKAERKYGKSITTLLWEQLEKNKELGVQRHAGGTRLRASLD